MKINKVLAGVISILLALELFTGCAGTPATSDSSEAPAEDAITVGIAQCDLSDKFQTYITDALKEEADKAGVKAIVTDAKNDTNTQIANVENLIAQGAQAIILVIVDTNSADPFVKLCEDNDVPLIGISRQFKGCKVFVGSDSTQAGTLQMEEVTKLLNNKGNVGILRGFLGNDDEVKRTAGNQEVLEKYPDVKLIKTDTAQWDRAKGMEVTETWLQSGEKFDAIVANNDEMAIGAIRALEAAQQLEGTIVAGIDATPDALQYVKDGKLTLTLFQNPFAQAKEAMNAAIKCVKGETIDTDVIWVPFEVVTKDNYKTYMGYWGITE